MSCCSQSKNCCKGLHLPPGTWQPGRCQGNTEETEKILYPARSRLNTLEQSRSPCDYGVCWGAIVRWWCCTVTFDQGQKKTGSPINRWIFSAQLRWLEIAQIPQTLKSRLTIVPANICTVLEGIGLGYIYSTVCEISSLFILSSRLNVIL